MTESYKAQTRLLLKNKQISLTMDHWSAAAGYNLIVGVVAHYIEKFESKEIKLACRLAPTPHTAEKVKNQFKVTLDDYEIEI